MLFFIIPGVIAYAVDFSTGAIYLPGGHRSSLENGDVKVVHVDPAKLDDAKVREVVMRETGISSAAFDKAKMYKLDGRQDIRARFAEAARNGYRAIAVPAGSSSLALAR